MLQTYRKISISEHIISRNENFVEPRNMQYRFKQLLETANLKPTDFKTLRHTFIARALESGFDVKALSEILGYASPVVIYEKYAHILNEQSRKRTYMNAVATSLQQR